MGVLAHVLEDGIRVCILRPLVEAVYLHERKIALPCGLRVQRPERERHDRPAPRYLIAR